MFIVSIVIVNIVNIVTIKNKFDSQCFKYVTINKGKIEGGAKLVEREDMESSVSHT